MSGHVVLGGSHVPSRGPSLALPASLQDPLLRRCSPGLEWARSSPSHLIFKLSRIILISQQGPLRPCELLKVTQQFGGRAGTPRLKLFL